MTKYWIIARETTSGKTEYLYRIRPTRWIDDCFLAKRLTEDEVIEYSKCLNSIKLPHSIRYVEEM